MWGIVSGHQDNFTTLLPSPHRQCEINNIPRGFSVFLLLVVEAKVEVHAAHTAWLVGWTFRPIICRQRTLPDIAGYLFFDEIFKVIRTMATKKLRWNMVLRKTWEAEDFVTLLQYISTNTAKIKSCFRFRVRQFEQWFEFLAKRKGRGCRRWLGRSRWLMCMGCGNEADGRLKTFWILNERGRRLEIYRHL